MNNPELESILRKAQVPARPEEFWEMFPRQIASRLKRAQAKTVRVGQNWFPRLAWGLATVVCILAAVAIGHWRGRMETEPIASSDILQDTKFVRETLAMFPNQVRAIVRDNHGLNLVLSNDYDVPASPPIYVRVCDGKDCSSCVTFSGQELEIAGQNVTILSDATGGVIVTGKRFAWSSDGKNYAGKNLKIEAKNLGTTL